MRDLNQFLHSRPKQANLTTKSQHPVKRLYDTPLGPGGSDQPYDVQDKFSNARMNGVTISGRLRGTEFDVTDFFIEGSAINLNGGDPFVVSINANSDAGTAHTHSVTVGSAFFTYSCPYLRGSANTDSENADSASAPTNSGYISAGALVGSFVDGLMTITTNPDVGRNIGIVLANLTAGAIDLFEGVQTYTVTGTYKGEVQTEDITITSSSGNKSVATLQYRYKYGLKPFDTISSIVFDSAPDLSFTLSVALGSKVGFPNNLYTPVEADITKATKNGADYVITGLVDTTNHTLNLADLTDAATALIIYKGSGSTPVISSESAHTHGITSASLNKYLVEYTP